MRQPISTINAGPVRPKQSYSEIPTAGSTWAEGNDHIYGGAGNDFVHGATGQDYLEGNDGNDELFGEADNDILVGQQGNDRLDGGTGVDRMIGGVGDDIYIVDSSGDNVVEFENGGRDQVLASANFSLGTHGRI